MAAMTSRPRASATLLLVALALIAGCGGAGGGSTAATTEPANTDANTTPAAAKRPQLGPSFGSMTSLPGALNSAPPWAANNASAALQLRLRKIGLEPLREEGQVVHIHQHLDLYVDGSKVTVPANIGIDAGQGFISDLHTHDATGILHVESPTQQSFSLGQFFAVWGVPLSPDCIGSRCAKGSRKLRVWVDGAEVTADPTRIVLAEHQQIAIAYGTAAQAPDPVPASYDFAAASL